MSSADPRNSRLIQTFTVRWLVFLLGVPMTYAVIRYHVFQGVEWSHFPLYVANKGCALAAVFLIAASYLIGKTLRVYEREPDRRLVLIKFCGLMGFSLAGIHAFMSLLIVSPHYYPKFFLDAHKMNLTGELSLLFGVLSLWCISITAITSLPFMYDAIGADRWHRRQEDGLLCADAGGRARGGHGLLRVARACGLAGTPSTCLAPRLHCGCDPIAGEIALACNREVSCKMSRQVGSQQAGKAKHGDCAVGSGTGPGPRQ